MNEDPIGLNGGDENFYSYVQNNPVGFVDFTGFVVVYAGGGATVGAGNDLEVEKPNHIAVSAGGYAGTTNNPDNCNVGAFASGVAGGIFGVTGGFGVIAGINFGQVEDLNSNAVQVGVVLLGISFALTFNEEASKITGFEFGFGGKGFGVGLFGDQIETITTGNNSTNCN